MEADRERPRSCLTAINGQLNERFSAVLNRCRSALESSLPADSVVEFRNTVTSCRTQLDYGLSALAEWFHVDYAQRMPPFLVSDLVEALLDNVRRYCGPCFLTVDRSIGLSRRLQGRMFRPLWDLFFILLDNIAKHAKMVDVAVELSIQDQGNGITLTVVNALGGEVDVERLRRAAASMSGNPVTVDESDLLRREGGSGLLKIHKILRYDLRLESYDVQLSAVDPRKFCVAIAIPDKGMYDESPSGG